MALAEQLAGGTIRPIGTLPMHRPMDARDGRHLPVSEGGLALVLLISAAPLPYLINMQVNYLPLQVLLAFLALFLCFRFHRLDAGVVFLFLGYAMLLALYHLEAARALVTNPILPSLTFLALAAASKSITPRNKALPGLMVGCLTTFLSLGMLALNLRHLSSLGFEARFRGLGSGTIYAFLALVILVHLAYRRRHRELSGAWVVLLSVGPILSILLTQSRGSILTLAALVLLAAVRDLVRLVKLLAATAMTAMLVTAAPSLAVHVPLLGRLDPANYKDLSAFTSGRLGGQEHILAWLGSESDPIRLMFGREGLNGVKNFTHALELQFPHLDLLYLVYDAGLAGVSIYLILGLIVLCRMPVRSYFLLYFLSALHTNMITTPTMLALCLVYSLDQAQRNATQLQKEAQPC